MENDQPVWSDSIVPPVDLQPGEKKKLHHLDACVARVIKEELGSYRAEWRVEGDSVVLFIPDLNSTVFIMPREELKNLSPEGTFNDADADFEYNLRKSLDAFRNGLKLPPYLRR